MSAHHKNSYTLIGAMTVQEVATIHAMYTDKSDVEIGEMLGRPYHHVKNYRRKNKLVKPQGNRKGRIKPQGFNGLQYSADAPNILMTSFLKSRFV